MGAWGNFTSAFLPLTLAASVCFAFRLSQQSCPLPPAQAPALYLALSEGVSLNIPVLPLDCSWPHAPVF